MARVTPRDVHVATVVGGAIIGVAFGAFGGLPLLSALAPPDAHPYLCALVGATFFLAGSAFFLVSVIILPAWRALRLELRSPA